MVHDFFAAIVWDDFQQQLISPSNGSYFHLPDIGIQIRTQFLKEISHIRFLNLQSLIKERVGNTALSPRDPRHRSPTCADRMTNASDISGTIPYKRRRFLVKCCEDELSFFIVL